VSVCSACSSPQELAETAAERSKRAEAAAVAERNRVVYETNMNLESVQRRVLEAQQQAEASFDPCGGACPD
jgi:hypothetical protein